MVFEEGGREIDSAGMRTYATGDAEMPLILVSRDRRFAYKVLKRAGMADEVERANLIEILLIATMYRLPELLKMLEPEEVLEAG